MSLTICDLLNIFPGSVIVAGEKKINNKITIFGAIDAPDSTKWVKPNEFIVSSGYIFKGDILLQKKIIKELSEKKSAGLGIKMHRHLDNIDIKVIKYANEKEFPVLKLPYRTTIYELSNLVFNYANKYNNSDHSQEKSQIAKNEFLLNVLTNNIDSKLAINFRANQLGVKLDRGYMVAVAKYKNECNNKLNDDEITDKLYKLFARIKYIFDIQGGIGDFSNIFFLIPSKIEEEAVKKANDIKSILKENFPDFNFNFGIGKYYSSSHHLFRSYYEALRVLEFSNRIFGNSEINTYNKLGIYRVLDYSKYTELKKFVRDYLGPIIDYDKKHNNDLIYTLESYIKNNCNFRKCANDTYLHRNTIRYRINKIEEIGDINLNFSEDLLNISIAIKLLKLVDLDLD